jgi:hypothetical protein
LRHFPYPNELGGEDNFDPAVVEEYYDEMEKKWDRDFGSAQAINNKSADS